MENYENIDVAKLKEDLIDYFGTAYFNADKFAIIELSKTEKLSDEEIVKMALKNGFIIENYKINEKL